MSRFLKFSVFALVLVFSPGCDSDDSDSGHDQHTMDGAATTTLSALTEADHFFVKLTPPSDKLPFNELFTLGVTVYDGKDQTQQLTDCSIKVDALMVAHGHGMTTVPAVEKNTDGSFACKGMMFHMAGQWDVMVEVTHNGVTDTATMPVACCP